MFSHRSHRYSQMFLVVQSYVLHLGNKICVNLRNLWEITSQAANECSPTDLTDIHRCFWWYKVTYYIWVTKICVNPRNLWEITSQAAYECSPADSTDIHRCS